MASEVIFDSEVYFVSEVLPCGRVANLTSLLQKAKTSPNIYKENSFMKDSELRTRAKDFALKIISVCDAIESKKGRGVLINQNIRH